MKTTTLTLAILLAAVAAPAIGDSHSAEDDLAVVKKATSSEKGRTPAEAPPGARAEEPQWLRVRIVETGEKKATSVK